MSHTENRDADRDNAASASPKPRGQRTAGVLLVVIGLLFVIAMIVIEKVLY